MRKHKYVYNVHQIKTISLLVNNSSWVLLNYEGLIDF
jgi:hypothetical protein